MTPRSKPKAMLTPLAFDDLKKLSGNVRRQMIIAIDELEQNPRPSNSNRLAIEGEIKEIRRIRSGKWRIVYLVLDERSLILAIRRRPPYDYDDLQRLIDDAG